MKLCYYWLLTGLQIFSKALAAENTEIEFTEDVSYSIEVAGIDVGDMVKWLPKNEEHNVEFLAGPEINALTVKSLPPIGNFSTAQMYLFGCTPHANIGMIDLVMVNDDLHKLGSIKKIKLFASATSVFRVKCSSPQKLERDPR